MGMADSNKRINLAAPLISVRRHGGAGAEATALPYYKPGEMSGPMGHAGTVPFRWEHRPGHPKSVRTRRPAPPPPPTTTVGKEATSQSQRPAAIAAAAVAARAEEEHRFSDARSRDDVSCVTVNCSATGLSDAASACAAAAPGSRGGAMMKRFLPAAHAVAVASPLSNFRKAGLSVREPVRAFDGDRLPLQRRLPLAQHIPTNHLKMLSPQNKEEDNDDAESDVNSTQGFASSKRCGLLPTRCVKSTLLLLNPAPAMRRSRGARRGEGRSQGEMMNPLLRRSRSGQQQQPPRRPGGGHDPDTQSWEELYVKSLLRSARGGLTSPCAAVASELDRTVREIYKHRGGRGAVHPKASHLGLLLVLDRSNEPCRGSSKPNAALLLPRTKSSPHVDDAGGYGFPRLLEDKAALQSPGREIVLSPQQAMLPALPSPKSPSESWLSRALPSVSNRPPPATSFLGLHVQSRKHAPLLPWSSIDSTKAVVEHARQRQIVRFHDLHK